MKMKMLSKKDRPRERLKELGVEVLSDVELLAIILGTGTKDMDVMALANYICKNYSIQGLKDLNYEQLIKIPGIKDAKASHIIATFEMVKRSIKMTEIKISFNNSKDVYCYLKSDFYNERKEKLVVIFLDTKLKPLKKRIFHSYSPDFVSIPVREIVEEGLKVNSSSIIIAHNHPSGDVTPSNADKEMTHLLFSTLKSLNINLEDHIIINNDKYYSFAENGLLGFDIEYDYLGDFFEKNI